MKTIYSNPVIIPGFYLAKVVSVSTSKVAGQTLPEVRAMMKILPHVNYPEEARNVELSCVIWGTPASQCIYDMFCQTFRIKNDVKEAIGRFASIGVMDSKYGKNEYSSVYFVIQSNQAIMTALALEKKDAAGGIPWDA